MNNQTTQLELNFNETPEQCRKRRAIETTYFPVSKRYAGNGKYYIVNDQTNDLISTVSKRYTLVRNETIFQPFVDHFGIDALKSLTTWGARKYVQAAFETGREFNLGTPERPDVIKERLIIANSYNKTKSFVFMMGAFRMVCSNGLYTGQCSINYRKIHVGEIKIHGLIKHALQAYKNNSFDLWKRFRDVSLTVNEAHRLIDTGLELYKEKEVEPTPWRRDNNAEVNSRIRGILRKRINRQDEAGQFSNAWHLYNEINWSIERGVVGKSKIDKRIAGNKTAEQWLAGRLNLN